MLCYPRELLLSILHFPHTYMHAQLMTRRKALKNIMWSDSEKQNQQDKKVL